MKRIILLLMISLLTLSVTAQTPKKQEKTSVSSEPKQRAVVDVIVKNGDIITLYDDMTYRRSETVDVSRFTTTPATASVPALEVVSPSTVRIQIQVGVVTDAGSVTPVARRQFVIFGEDVNPTLATLNGIEGGRMDIFGFFSADRFQSTDRTNSYARAMEKIKPSIIGNFTTDFEGRGVFEVPRSNESYYIYGWLQVGRSYCVWYSKFTADKDASFVLDNNNAEYCR